MVEPRLQGVMVYYINVGMQCERIRSITNIYQQKSHKDANGLYTAVIMIVIIILVVIKDYENTIDAVTLIHILSMISLSDFEPLSIAKINIFSSTTGVLRRDNSVTKSMPF